MSRDPGSLLPLKTAWFHVLLALADGAQHGFAIRQIVQDATDGAVNLWPATLYGAIRDLAERGVIEALEGPDDPDDDRRRRYYQLTSLGREVLRAETDRLQRLIDAARATRALSQT